MNSFNIKKGHNIFLEGSPSKELIISKSPQSIVLHPNSIKNMKTKLFVKVGDKVKVGTPVFASKNNLEAVFVSPCSGTIEDIVFGPRRVVEEIVISNKTEKCLDLDFSVSKNSLLKSGLWNVFRQKPFSKIPNSETSPNEIYISAMPTEPFALDYEFLFSEVDNFLQKGIDALKQIFDCEINFSSFNNSSIFSNLKNVNHYSFNNLHPAGNVGVQIHHIKPIKNSDDTRWYISLQDLNRIGEFYTTKKYPNHMFVSVGGNSVFKPAIYKIMIGAKVSDFIKIDENSMRLISGDVLNGSEINNHNSLNYFDEVLSAIKVDNKREFLGWLMPGFDKYSISNTFLSKFNNNKSAPLSTKVNGSVRTIVPMGNWDKVMPMDIMTEYLVKNILAKDIEMMEKLGIYECSPEDFSLCSFSCQSKVEVSKIIQEGLDLIEAEG